MVLDPVTWRFVLWWAYKSCWNHLNCLDPLKSAPQIAFIGTPIMNVWKPLEEFTFTLSTFSGHLYSTQLTLL